ncbi:hydroxycarboxylic acid receptor 2-like [Boleophthalmus pectinirostris]|uniref:hydroxycarboxylic acid receptor 2-like n=1 Tax=Boleophthalmus pectinirostris TaxID=150288 RepID=UPI00242AC5AA|nr:hydroxycarboxylic acid receptor 2-like [Boleophthalmus pectinirostris]
MNCSYNITVLSSVLPPVLGVAFTLGAVGNAFALWIFCFHLRPWRSSTVLLFSLALADVLLLVALPFRISYYSSNFEWKFGNTFCSICYLLASMNRTGSTLFLIVIALDRYMHVVHPHNPVNFMSVSKSVCGAVILWLLTVMVSTFFTLYKSKKSYCGDFRSRCEWNTAISGHRLAYLLAFYVPFLVILFSTTSIVQHLRRRRIAQHAQVKKALLVLISIIILFVVCFLPSNITQLVIWSKVRTTAMWGCAEMQQITIIYTLTASLTYLNSAMDPVVYFFSSTDFRNKCKSMLGLKPSLDSTERGEESTQPEFKSVQTCSEM